MAKFTNLHPTLCENCGEEIEHECDGVQVEGGFVVHTECKQDWIGDNCTTCDHCKNQCLNDDAVNHGEGISTCPDCADDVHADLKRGSEYDQHNTMGR